MKTLPTRILIVEDNADDEALLLRQLTKADLHTQVKVIADGGEAVAYLSDAGRDLDTLIAVFLDLQLPTLRGEEVLKTIRSQERTRNLPVVVMTSTNEPRELERCRTLGITAFVAKPVTFATFARAVASAFHSNETAGPVAQPPELSRDGEARSTTQITQIPP